MNIDPFKMLFFGFIVLIILAILAYYSLKLSIQIINNEYLLDSHNISVENDL